MGTAFKKALIVFIVFILILGGVLISVILNYSEYVSFPETMQMVDFSGILVSVLGACLLSLVSVVLTFWLARAWVNERPELGERIVHLALIVSVSLIVVFGGLAGGLVVLRTLWTIGFF